jgi:para-aminobenzoate synthetase component 1
MALAGFQRMNELGSAGEAFLFIIDFSLAGSLVLRPEEAREQGILFTFQDMTNHPVPEGSDAPLVFTKYPVSFERYNRAFEKVMCHIRAGDSYLVNLTFPTPVSVSLTLPDIYRRSQAAYKLLVNDSFVVFSPEKFVTINERMISSFPMKGTIDATLPDAEKILIANPKELAEHHTIVDLIRNDLSMVARKVRVERFRYIDRIETNFSPLLQVSSHITGELQPDYKRHLGDIFRRILPAGSVTGAPKQRTVEIIRKTENYRRGFYTGVMGYFDGENLDSGVMIRFIEQTSAGLVYKSGGGITSFSDASEEYEEMIAKVYVPFI